MPFLNQENLEHLDFGGIISSASGITSAIVEQTVNLGKNIGTGLIYLIISLIIIYYYMIDKDTINNAVLKMFPSSMRKRTASIIDNISEKVGGYVVAQIATMARVGVIVTIGLSILRVDYALLLGLLTAIFDIIPAVGPALAFIICMVAVYKAGPIVLIITAVIFGTAQLAENNFVRPFVFGKLLNLHPLIIYLFLFIAAKYMGLTGVIFAPAIAAMFVVLIEEVYMRSIE